MPQDIDQLPTTQAPSSQPDAGGAGVPKEGMPGSGKSDAGKSVDLSKYVPVEQLNKLRSTMDKQIADQRRQFETLQQQYQELVAWREKNETEGLTDEELVAYEAQKAQYEAQQQIAKTRQEADRLAYERNFLALKNYYLSKGAPQEIVQLEDAAEMQEAYLNWLIDGKRKAEEALAKSQQSKPDKDGKQPPPVTTHKPAAGSLGKASWSSVKPGSAEEAKLFEAIASGAMKPEDVEP